MSIDPADLGFDAFFSAQRDALPAEWVPARVVAEGQNSFHLLGCRAPFGDLSGRLLRSKHKLERPIVGDWVAVVDGAERASIQHLFDRRTALVRRAAGTLAEPQVIAAVPGMTPEVLARILQERAIAPGSGREFPQELLQSATGLATTSNVRAERVTVTVQVPGAVEFSAPAEMEQPAVPADVTAYE